ncbi:hypothetical protein E9L24_004617 [Escherichia coli]|nr:hypothetical protein [Escherichia coli]
MVCLIELTSHLLTAAAFDTMNLALNKTGNIAADNALNQWLYRIHKTDIIILSCCPTHKN